MRFVETAPIRPSRCAVFPQIGSNHPKGFFDTGSEMPGFDNHIYVSVVAVEEMAKKLGWHSPESAGMVEAQLESYKHRVAALEDEVQQLNQEFEAIDLLESAGYTARKKSGRKPQPKEPLA